MSPVNAFAASPERMADLMAGLVPWASRGVLYCRFRKLYLLAHSERSLADPSRSTSPMLREAVRGDTAQSSLHAAVNELSDLLGSCRVFLRDQNTKSAACDLHSIEAIALSWANHFASQASRELLNRIR